MLCNQTSRIYCDIDELNGLETAARNMATQYAENDALQHAEAYQTIADVAHILATHRLNYPRDFFVVFERIHFENDFKEVE